MGMHDGQSGCDRVSAHDGLGISGQYTQVEYLDGINKLHNIRGMRPTCSEDVSINHPSYSFSTAARRNAPMPLGSFVTTSVLV